MEGASIAEEIGNGSRQAEDQLVARYDGTLMTQVRRMTRDVHDAEDICQEVMHVVIEKLRRRQLRNPNALDEFVRQVGKYQTVEFYRRRKWLEYRGECDPVDPTPDCHGHASLREERQLVRDIIHDLGNERDRQILHMFYVQEFDKNDICQRLNLDGMHFYRVLHRARNRFKVVWGERIG